MGKQGKGRRLTDKERMEIIALTRQNPRIKHVELAAKYNVNESTIRKWRAQGNASKIEERYAHGVAASRDGRQRGQAVRNAQFDAKLYEWVAAIMKQEQDIAPARVREKARAMAAQYDGMDGFKASSGWFYRFCRRYGLPCGPASTRDSGSKMHDTMAMDAMMPLDGADTTLEAPQPALTELHGAAFPTDDTTGVSASGSAAAIALSLQPPCQSLPQSPVDAPVAAVTTEASELEGKAPANVAPAAATSSAVVLGLGDVTTVSPPPPTTSAPTESPIISAVSSTTVPVAMPQTFSMAQAAATHMVHHFKDVLDPQTRLRLVRHFTRVAGEAEMYLVMDDETRLEYVKEFATTPATTSPPPVSENGSA